MPDQKKSWRGLRLAGVIVAIVAIVIVVHGVMTRASENSRLREWTDAQALPTVAIVSPANGANNSGLELPGRLEAYARAPIYARVSGYIKDYKVDIGAQVKAGQLLADIETPDVDQQLSQARADLVTAQANEKLAKLTSDRWQTIVKTGAVAKQDADEKLGDYQAKQAMTAASQANVDRLVAMKGFARIIAPFDGVVTARNTDVGALINVGSSAGQELFVVSDTHKLRMYVNVPQNYVPLVPPGTKATMIVPEHPGKKYEATVESSAQAVNANSGTTLMQLGVDNASGELLPGGYATVRLDLPRRGGCAEHSVERADLQRERFVGRDRRQRQPRRREARHRRARSRQDHRNPRWPQRGRQSHRKPAGRHRDRHGSPHRRAAAEAGRERRAAERLIRATRRERRAARC